MGTLFPLTREQYHQHVNPSPSHVVTSTTMDPQIRLLLLEQLLASKGIDIDAELAGVAIGLDGSVVFGAVKPGSGEGTGQGEPTPTPVAASPAASTASEPASPVAAPAPAATPAAPPDILAALTGGAGANGATGTNHDPSNKTVDEQAKYLNEVLLPSLMAGRETVTF